MSLENSVTPPGIDPGTVRLVAQRLNHYATPGPPLLYQLQKLFAVRCDETVVIHSALEGLKDRRCARHISVDCRALRLIRDLFEISGSHSGVPKVKVFWGVTL
jgi:hypothetical protein